jgi:hypothetical protein
MQSSWIRDRELGPPYAARRYHTVFGQGLSSIDMVHGLYEQASGLKGRMDSIVEYYSNIF